MYTHLVIWTAREHVLELILQRWKQERVECAGQAEVRAVPNAGAHARRGGGGRRVTVDLTHLGGARARESVEGAQHWQRRALTSARILRTDPVQRKSVARKLARAAQVARTGH